MDAKVDAKVDARNDIIKAQEWAYALLQEQMLRDFNDSGATGPKPTLEQLSMLFQYLVVPKGGTFLEQGQVADRIAFVAKGFFRYCYLTPTGEDITKHFAVENDFVCAYASMLYQRPSAYGIVAEEDSVVLVISRDQYMSLIEAHRSWERMARRYTEHIYNLKEIREASLLLLDAKARYEEFVAMYPGLLARAKQRHIATYLGIHPVSLSRLRGREKS